MNQYLQNIARNKYCFLISIIAIIYFIYVANPALYYFLNDDFIHIPMASKKNFLHGSLFRPLSDLSLLIDYTFWEKNAFGYHLTNVAIHLINSILVFFCSSKVFGLVSDNNIKIKSFSAALLFLLYSNHSESIFWIIGRGGSLTTLFFLCSFIFYLKANKNGYYLLLCLSFFLLGLLTYETIWSFPLIVTILYFQFPKENKKRHIIVIWLVFIAYLGFRFSETKGLDVYEFGSVYALNVKKLFYNYNALLARCFLPPLKNSYLFLLLYFGFVFFVLISMWRLRKSKTFFTIVLCLLVSVLPAVSLGIDTHDSESERFIYLATFFAVLLLIELLAEFNRFIFGIGLVFLILFHAVHLRNTSDSYRFSSMIAKRSLECIEPLKSKIIAIDLPSQYKGALIFRIGFPQAVQWMKGISRDSVYIVSAKEYFEFYKNLNCYYIKNDEHGSFDDLEKQVVGDKNSFIGLKWSKDSLLIKRY